MTLEVERKEEKTTVLHWTVKEFSSLDSRVDARCESPEFFFGGRRFVLFLYPNGRKCNKSEGYVVLGLSCLNPPLKARYSVGFRTKKGGREVRQCGTQTFDLSLSLASVRLIERSELFRRGDKLLPQDVLTLTLELKVEDGSCETGLASSQRPVSDTQLSSASDAKNLSKAILTADKSVQVCSDVPPDLESLPGDFRQLMEREIFPDVKLRCGDRTVSAHRSILALRSDVFAAMFRNKIAESEMGTFDVTEVDSETLDLLLQYVYSGKIPDLSDNTAFRLYEAGDKYSIHSLKKSCSDWMVRNLSDENCLFYLVVADAHGDEDFKDCVVDFVAENLESLKKDAVSRFSEDYGRLAISVFQRRLAPELSKQS